MTEESGKTEECPVCVVLNEESEKTLDEAITIGKAICDELGLCEGKTQGRVISQVYRELAERKARKLAESLEKGGQESGERERASMSSE